jgi:ribosomal protein L11 methyltransferase
MPDYLTVSCRLPAAAEEHLAQALERWPVLGCEVEDSGPDVDVTIYLEEARSGALSQVCEGLLALGARELGTGHFAEQDWLSIHRTCVTASAVGRSFWIDPHPDVPSPPPDGRIHLVIEPRQAFGTGSHESTQLVLLGLEDLAVAGKRILDVGTGSGILALASRALGAATVVGCDIDLEAVVIAYQTAKAQPQPWSVGVFAGSTSALRSAPGFDVILANLLPAQLEPLLHDLRRLLDRRGALLVSGLMEDQRAAVEAELRRANFVVGDTRQLGEWVAIACTPATQRVGARVPKRTAQRPATR